MLRGPYKKTTNDVRQRLCAAYQSGQVLTSAADVIGIGRQTAKRIVKRFVEEDSHEKRKVGGNRLKK
jgi:transposase